MPVRRSSNCIPSSPVQFLQPPMKQGIVTILGADCDRNEKAGSIRKTLSADMSSKKWLEQNGFFSPIKKIASSQEIAADPDHQEMDDVWRSIQKNNEMQKPPQTGVWGSILTQKSDDSLLPPPPAAAPYVLPSVKRSTSSLSEKSLEICTESLGSETGLDCLSGYLAGEGLSDGDEEREDMLRSEGEEVRGKDPFTDLHVVKYKNSPVRPLPPPLPSIVGDDGASLRMQSHRENGRLVLEAVSVAPRNYFHAQRHDGRLVLTSMHGPKNLEDKNAGDGDVEETVDYDGGDEEEGESGDDEQEFVVEENLSLPTGMISVHKSGLVMKKFMTLGNINPKWSNKCDELPILQSLPPRPPMARLISSSEPPVATTASSFNAYEYFWRSKPMITPNRNKMNQDLVSYMRGCKEARRSLLWEPCCIATS